MKSILARQEYETLEDYHQRLKVDQKWLKLYKHFGPFKIKSLNEMIKEIAEKDKETK